MTFPDSFVIGVALGAAVVSWWKCDRLRKEIVDLKVYRDWHEKRISTLESTPRNLPTR